MSDDTNIIKDVAASGLGTVAGGMAGGLGGAAAGAGSGMALNALVGLLTRGKGDDLANYLRKSFMTGGGAIGGGIVGSLGGAQVGSDMATGKYGEANELNKQGNDMSNIDVPKPYLEGFEDKCAEFGIDPAKLVETVDAMEGEEFKQAEASPEFIEGFTAIMKSAGLSDEEVEAVCKKAGVGPNMRRNINNAASAGKTVGKQKAITAPQGKVPVAGADKGMSVAKKILAGLGIGGAAGAGVAAATSGDDEDVTDAAKDKVDAATKS